MMKKYIYKTHGTCSRQIAFETDGNTVKNVQFTFGCSGNTQGISALVENMEVDKVISLLSNIDCNGRGTSCPDQLAKALTEVKMGKLDAKEA